MPYSSRRTSTGSLRPGNTSSPLTFGPRRTPEESSASATTNTATIATTIRISQRTMTPRIPPQCVLGLVTCRPHRRPVATLLTNSFEALLLRSRHIHAACCYAATVGRRVGDPNDPKKALSSVSIRAQLIRRANEGRKRSGPHTTDQTGDDDEVHGDRESVQGFGDRPDAERAAARGDGQVQRGTREGRNHARRRGAASQFEGRSGALLRIQAHGDRRSVRRDEGAGRGILAVAGPFQGRSDRVAQTLPESARRGDRGRDPPGVRGGGLRRGVHARIAPPGRTRARAGREGQGQVAAARTSINRTSARQT